MFPSRILIPFPPCPKAHVERGILLSTVVAGLSAGLAHAEKAYGLTSKLIMCFVKHLPVQSAFEAVEAIAPYVQNGQVTGVGCDSTEIGNPPEKYTGVYNRARELGITHLTAHVGEEGPGASSYPLFWLPGVGLLTFRGHRLKAQSVRTAVEDMGILRIDHGIHAADDPELLKVLAERNAFLTLCPLSNVRLRCVSKVSEVPIPQLMAAGVKFSINSDDPAYVACLFFAAIRC